MWSLPENFGLGRLQLVAVFISAFVFNCAGADWNDEVGLQLESVHATMGRNLPGALGRVHDFGFKYVELVGDYGRTPEALNGELQSNQLTAVSAHFTYAKWRDDPEGIASEAERLGLKMAGCPALPQKDKLDVAGCQAAVAVFNRAGARLAKHNIQFFYHPHGYEFKPYGEGTLFDLLASQTDPKLVHFEMDVFWIVRAGQDPVKLFEKYGHRWIAMHLKDMKKGTATGLFDSHADISTFLPCGQGQIDLPTVVKAAQKLGIKWYFIEDESVDPIQGIPQSVRYLQQMTW